MTSPLSVTSAGSLFTGLMRGYSSLGWAGARVVGISSILSIRLAWSWGKCWRIVLSVVVWRSQVRAGLAIWVCMPDQTHIRSSREANCTKIPLAAGRLERTKPFFVAALRGHAIHRFVHPDRPRLIGPRRLVFLGRGTTLNFAAIKFLV